MYFDLILSHSVGWAPLKLNLCRSSSDTIEVFLQLCFMMLCSSPCFWVLSHSYGLIWIKYFIPLVLSFPCSPRRHLYPRPSITTLLFIFLPLMAIAYWMRWLLALSHIRPLFLLPGLLRCIRDTSITALFSSLWIELCRDIKFVRVNLRLSDSLRIIRWWTSLRIVLSSSYIGALLLDCITDCLVFVWALCLLVVDTVMLGRRSVILLNMYL